MGALEEAGYGGTRVPIKSDQEEAIVSLKKAVCLARKADTARIESPVRASQSNGKAERANRTRRNKVCVLRIHLEKRIGEKIPKDRPLLEWIYVWAGQVITKYHVGPSGLTAYEGMTGLRAKHGVCGLGEYAHFAITLDTTNVDNEMPVYSRGICLGMIMSTTEWQRKGRYSNADL